MVVAITTFSLAAIFIVLVPGPDTLIVLRALVRGGRVRAARTVAGVLCGQVVWVGAAALGLSALLQASHVGYLALKIAGGAYLIALGVQSLRRRHAAPDGAGTRSILGTGFLGGFTSDVLNPKVGVFFVTFMPAFVPSGGSVGATTLLFGAIFSIETAAYFVALLTVATRVTRWMADERIRRRMDVGTGAILIGLGARLAIEP
jgi:threonine/homoserine/homoserine lactone efflux protein